MIRAALLAFVLAAATWPAAYAQAYPDKPVRLIVPFSAGGPADLLGRLIAEKLTRSLGQTVVVINKDGAGTILGVDMAAKATPHLPGAWRWCSRKDGMLMLRTVAGAARCRWRWPPRQG